MGADNSTARAMAMMIIAMLALVLGIVQIGPDIVDECGRGNSRKRACRYLTPAGPAIAADLDQPVIGPRIENVRIERRFP